MDDKKYLELQEDKKETLQMIISELKEIANSPDDPEERIEYLKQFIPETPIEVLSKDLDEMAKSVTSSDEVIDISDSSISIEPKFACKNGEPSDIISFSIVYDRLMKDKTIPKSYSLFMDRILRNSAYGLSTGVFNYFPRRAWNKFGNSWWYTSLIARRLASIFCGDYYKPYDTSSVNLQSVVYMSTYYALPEMIKNNIITLDSVAVYSLLSHTAQIWLDDCPSKKDYLKNLTWHWAWPIGYGVDSPSAKFNDAIRDAKTKDKNVTTKHKKH